MSKKERSRFGSLLSKYRRNSIDPDRGGRLTQEKLVELLGLEDSKLALSGPRISNWERGQEKIDHENRNLLVSLIRVLHANGGIRTFDEANELLVVGEYRRLNTEEAQRINQSWTNEMVEHELHKEMNLDEVESMPDREFPSPILLGNIPPRPPLFVGREEDLRNLKERIGLGESEKTSLSIIRGWPGVGKSTTVLSLAHEAELGSVYPDGVLWAALGESGSVISHLTAWGRVLGVEDLNRLNTIEEMVSRLTILLRDKKMLLIIDDVWTVEQGVPFKIGGEHCATIFTTRFQDVARALADIPDEQIYILPVLSDGNALDLLRKLTPKTVERYFDDSLTLVKELEGLPLAIQVAGRLLNEEQALGWGVSELIVELREGAKILASAAPADRVDIETQTTPTVAALLKKSTDTLNAETRNHFAFLGAFAPKPATFDLAAMAAVWQEEDPRPFVRTLVSRGLLERIGSRFQMHAVLVAHAKLILLEEEE